VTAVGVEDWQRVGLFDPDAPGAAHRLELLDYLSSIGLTPEDVVFAGANNRLGRLAADRVLWGDAGPTLTVSEIAERAGLDVQVVLRLMRAAGIPDSGDKAVFREEHALFFRAFANGQEFFGQDAILQFVRVLGATASTIAEAAVGLFLSSVSPRLRDSGLDELERVRESAEAVQSFIFVPTAMQVLLREHFVTAVRRLGLLLDAGEGGETSVVIGFVDLVGSTVVARDVPTAQLVSALSDFEGAALDAALAHDVRIVKHIGDEVMLVGARAPDVVRTVWRIVRFVEMHPAWQAARAGIAAGLAVTRDGDYFGPVVNTAARLATLAEPGEVLVNDAVAGAVDVGEFAVDDTGERLLRGFEDPIRVSRVRPLVASPSIA
jgi:adenylate cyclase